MNIKDIDAANIPADIAERLKPVVLARIEDGKLRSIPDVEQFFLDMSKEGVGDAAIMMAAHAAKQGVAHAFPTVVALREWATQYRQDLLGT